VAKFKALLLDMDGVVWRDTEAIGDLPRIFEEITSKNLKTAFVTNNATKTVEQYQEKFRGFGIDIPAEHIHTSSKVTAAVLSDQHPNGGNVYAIGERGLREALEERGFTIAEKDCVAVVVGLDRELSYEKLLRATLLIRGGAEFIGTNPDRTLPSPQGEVPGAGTILAALEASTGMHPSVIGKPGRAMLDNALAALGVVAEDALMIGDRVDTDIAAGQSAGCKTGLVLTGVSSEQAGRAWKPAVDYIEADLATLIKKL
jgi:4-nitrophenyl phosphatase